MIQTITAAGIIEPGLYQINGTGIDDLVRIGEHHRHRVRRPELPCCCPANWPTCEANPVFQVLVRRGRSAPGRGRLHAEDHRPRRRAGGRPDARRRLASARGGAAIRRQPDAAAGRPRAARARDRRRRQRGLQRRRRPLPGDGRAGLRRQRGLPAAAPDPGLRRRRSMYRSAASLPPVEDGTWTAGWWRASATISIDVVELVADGAWASRTFATAIAAPRRTESLSRQHRARLRAAARPAGRPIGHSTWRDGGSRRWWTGRSRQAATATPGTAATGRAALSPRRLHLPAARPPQQVVVRRLTVVR